MPSSGILCTAMFRFERERVLHCCLYRGTAIAYPVTAYIEEQQSHTQPLPASRDRNSNRTPLHVKREKHPKVLLPLHNPSSIHFITVRSTVRFPHRWLPSDSFRACRIRSVLQPVFPHSSADTASMVLHHKSDHNHDR